MAKIPKPARASRASFPVQGKRRTKKAATLGQEGPRLITEAKTPGIYARMSDCVIGTLNESILADPVEERIRDFPTGTAETHAAFLTRFRAFSPTLSHFRDTFPQRTLHPF